MKIAFVAHNFSIPGKWGNTFIARRMVELAKGDDPYGVRIERRDLAEWRYRKLVVAGLGRKFGPRAAAAFFRLTHLPLLRTRPLVVDGALSSIQVLVLRHVEDSEIPSVGNRSIARIARALRRRGCDIVHSHFLWYADMGARIAAEMGVPHIITVHGSEVYETMLTNEGIRAIFVRILEESQAAIFVSRAILQETKLYGYSGRNAHITYNGFDPHLFFPPEPSENRREGTRMLYVGNLVARKGADRLPRIFSIVAREIPSARLDIVGRDTGEGLDKTIRAEVARLGHSDAVSLLGPLKQREIADLMRKSDLLIVPSRNEGFGCAAIEAQACGTPVLGTATGGLPEVIGDSEMTVAQDGDFEATFAQKAVAVLLSRKRRVRPDLASLTWGEVVRGERKIYEEALARKRGERHE